MASAEPRRTSAGEPGALTEAAARAGAAAIESVVAAGDVRIDYKTARHDLVTTADRASEAAIVGVLRSARPDDTILAEETGLHEGPSGVRWLVDPLDGTINFVYRRSDYAVSVAAEHGGVLLAGAIVRPADGRCVVTAGDELTASDEADSAPDVNAGDGGGAAVTSRTLTLARPVDVPDALVAFGLPYSLGCFLHYRVGRVGHHSGTGGRRCRRWGVGVRDDAHEPFCLDRPTRSDRTCQARRCNAA